MLIPFLSSCSLPLFLSCSNLQPSLPSSYWKVIQTGNWLPPNPPLTLPTNTPIHGPITGTFLAKPAIVPRKSPKRITIPYSSTKKPTKAQRMRMRKRPRKKAAVPLSFCFRAKKARVFWGPIIIVRPRRKRIWVSIRDWLVAWLVTFRESIEWFIIGRENGTHIAHCEPGEV